MMFDFRELSNSGHQLLRTGYQVLLLGYNPVDKYLRVSEGFVKRFMSKLDSGVDDRCSCGKGYHKDNE